MSLRAVHHHHRRLEARDRALADIQTNAHLIRLAVLRVASLRPAQPNSPAALSSHDYQVQLHKLKQDHATKEQLAEARIESLNNEVARLRKKAAAPPTRLAPMLRSTGPRPLATLFDNVSPSFKADHILLPVRAPKPRGLSEKPGRGEIFDVLPLSPSTPTRKKPVPPLGSPDANSTTIDSALSRHSLFVSATSGSRAPSVGGTPGRDSDDTFASANSSLSKPTKRKIFINKARATKIVLKPLALDDEHDPNSLDYYHDDNFKLDASSWAPSLASLKRPLLVEPDEARKRAKNVFTIN